MIARQLSLAGQLVTYYSSRPGEPAGIPVIFLHGWRLQAAVWFPLIQSLLAVSPSNPATNRFAYYALDLPGFGKSAPPARTFTLQDYCDVVREFCEKLDLRGVYLVGHSFGGRVAIKLAATHSDLVHKLVLADSAGIRIGQTRRNILGLIAKILKPLFRPHSMQHVRHALYWLIGAGDYLATPELQQTFVRVIEEDLTNYLPDISCPTLILWGDRDTETPLSAGQQMAAMIPQATLSVLPCAGHASFLDQPEKFRDLLLEFITA
ncbi:MAG: alpha/beta hydrolase [Candidatus Liptonbacteria bacterium]|nr:alpha/beta hydrolase [Candidatus Liptonbacteria bacterium]